jgi:DUF438 domain-containing protein
MSEVINNREYRQKILKELIMELHNGKDPGEVKERFAKLIEGVSPSEISDMEQALIMEGMPVTEVQRLCDVHAAVFKGTIEEIHHPDEIPGHPVHTFKLENREIEKLINETIKKDIEAFKKDDTGNNMYKLIEDLNLLWDIDKHYSRKENLLFPYLEKYGITAPPKVMWGVDDEIRDGIKEGKKLLVEYNGNREEVVQKLEETINKVLEMVFKEESILFPMALDTLIEDEWIKIMNESEDIGYCLTEPSGKWKPARADVESREQEKLADEASKGYIKFETGILRVDEINAIFNTLPFDITFIDKDDLVKYFTMGKERIFARTKAVIGRSVQNCHPPGSVHIVEKMVQDFKSGKKDHEDFWIRMGNMYVYIRYFAVRDENGQYMGTLEVTQNIQPIKELEGEKRLVEE